jgi:hypothetical protein
VAQLTSKIPAIEAPTETRDADKPAEEQQGRGESPGPMREGRRRTYRGRGGVGCLEDSKDGDI